MVNLVNPDGSGDFSESGCFVESFDSGEYLGDFGDSFSLKNGIIIVNLVMVVNILEICCGHCEHCPWRIFWGLKKKLKKN